MSAQDRLIVACVVYPGEAFQELDLSFLWPAVPRLGEHLRWSDDDGEWQATVTEVVWHLEPDLATNESRVWIDGGDAERLDDLEPPA